MPRGDCTYRKRDLATALKAAKDADLPVARYEIDRDGKIVVLIGEPTRGAEQTPSDENDFGG